MAHNGGSDSVPPERSFCAGKNCNFYGDPVTGLCSKCARDKIKLEQQQASSVKPAADPSMATAATGAAAAAAAAAATASLEPAVTAAESRTMVTGAAADALAAESSAAPERSPQPEGRCFMCKKKIGLLGFECRCGYSFCSTHRYDTAHNCTFDHKSREREQLTKNNPLIMHKKIDQI